MPIIFDESYFKGSGYVNYSNYPHFKERAIWIQKNLSGTILEIGCASGYLIYELDNLGVQIFGIDKSSYSISKVSPSITARITHGDIAELWNYFAIPFDWIVSWNVLDCLDSPTHAEQVCEQLNQLSRDQFHVLATDGDHFTEQGYFIRNYAYWRNLLPNATIIEEMGKVNSSFLFSEVPLSFGRVSL